MKNEERIIEILAESLRKQDRQEELLTKLVESHLKQGETLEKHGTLIEKQGVILEKQSGILGKLLEGQERLTTEFHRMCALKTKSLKHRRFTPSINNPLAHILLLHNPSLW